jgi:hypothetical protein
VPVRQTVKDALVSAIHPVPVQSERRGPALPEGVAFAKSALFERTGFGSDQVLHLFPKPMMLKLKERNASGWNL